MASNNTTMPKVSKRAAIIVAVLVVLLLGWGINEISAEQPDNVFWLMMNNNLASISATCHITQASSAATRDEYLRIQYGQTPVAHTITSLTENGSSVQTESLTTPSATYVRYTAIKAKIPVKLNTKAVLNIWGEGSNNTNGNTKDADFSQAARQGCGLPIANISSQQRDAILSTAKNQLAFGYDVHEVKTVVYNGHKAYQYAVTIQPVPYVTFMQSVAKAAGLHDLDHVRPASYAQAAVGQVILTVDKHSKQLLRVGYAGSNQQDVIVDRGLVTPIKLPTKTISLTDLQNRLQRLR